MFEILKILFCGQQPVPKITNRTLNKIIQREYPDNVQTVKHKLSLIQSDTQNGKNRLSMAVLKLSDRDITKLDHFIDLCNTDFRDIILLAEYPKISKIDMFETERTASYQLKKYYLSDWTDYKNWINKK